MTELRRAMPDGLLGATAVEKAQDRDEERGARDRPDDGKARAADCDDGPVGEVEFARDEVTDERADEAERDAPEAAGARAPHDRLTDGTAATGDDEEDEEFDQGHGGARKRGGARKIWRLSKVG